VGQVAPGDAGAVDVEDGVEDLAQVVGGGASFDAGVGAGLAPGQKMRCDECPSGVGKVAGVGGSVGHSDCLR
jgi:hypothetical protein